MTRCCWSWDDLGEPLWGDWEWVDCYSGEIVRLELNGEEQLLRGEYRFWRGGWSCELEQPQPLANGQSIAIHSPTMVLT